MVAMLGTIVRYLKLYATTIAGADVHQEGLADTGQASA
jgi:hypothetical protein